MTMKIADTAPDEAQLVEISERLNTAFSDSGTLAVPAIPVLDLDPSFLQAARHMLATLSDGADSRSGAFHGSIPQSERQIEAHLDFSPDFLETAKQMLRDFIKRTEAHRST